MNMNIISKYLQFLRKSNNYTQDDLAKELGISRQAVAVCWNSEGQILKK